MFETLLFIVTIATLGMLSPGPDFFLVIKNATRYSRLPAMMTALGVIAGVATHMAYCVAGFAVVITTTSWLFNILKYAGAIYFILIGMHALLARGGRQLNISTFSTLEISLKKAFLQGYLCNLLNPKATLLFLAMFTQVLSTHGEKLLYALIIWSLAAVWWPLLVLLIQSEKVRNVLQKVQKKVDKFLGIVLIILGIKLALS